MSPVARTRAAASLLLVAAYALLALAHVRLASLEAAARSQPADSAGVRESIRAAPADRAGSDPLAGVVDAFSTGMEREISLLEREADRRLPSGEAGDMAEPAGEPTDAEAALRALYRAELLAAVRAGVDAALPGRWERLSRALDLAPDQVPAVRAAVVRVSANLAERAGARLADALDRPAAAAFLPLDEEAERALRAALEGVLTPEQRARLGELRLFGEEGS